MTNISFWGLLRVITGLPTIPSYTEALPGQHGSCRKSSQDVAGFSGLSGSRCGFGSLGVGFQIFSPWESDSYLLKKKPIFFSEHWGSIGNDTKQIFVCNLPMTDYKSWKIRLHWQCATCSTSDRVRSLGSINVTVFRFVKCMHLRFFPPQRPNHQ